MDGSVKKIDEMTVFFVALPFLFLVALPHGFYFFVLSSLTVFVS